MANLKVNNYHILKLRINNDEYWDFFINTDSYGHYSRLDDESMYDGCLMTYVKLFGCDEGQDVVYGDYDYTWDNAISVGYTLHNISYLGVDNGLFTFRKDMITNKDFVRIFQENKLKLDEGDKRLVLHRVSGNTLQYEYPLHCTNEDTVFNGGFYQGFFKTECDKYQVLPSSFNDGEVLNLEFLLNKCELEKESDKTLNDKYPENKGIFFYLGTRAENKWIYLYDKDDIDGLEACHELGVDDFVEDGEIDKRDYIIGNFYDVDVDFEEDPPLDIDDYTNFNYYDDELYENDACDWLDMSDYLEISPTIVPKTIDENSEHVTLTWCCNATNEKEYILRPYFVGCSCPIRYKKEYIPKEGYDDDNLSCATAFGEGDYIGDFDGLGDLEDCMDYVERELDITDFEYYTDNGFNLSEANWYYFYTDNKFLMFDRTKDGKTVENWTDGTQYMYCGRRKNFNGNLFILMNRTKTGYTVSDIDNVINENVNYYNPYNDLYNNAFALRITDDGEIGYRMLTLDCGKEGRDKTKIIEGYSSKGIIKECEWTTINVRVNFLGGDKMKLMFYVNGKLVYMTSELPRIKLKALNDLYEKQEGVPYNISIGGGTQGLAETIQYNYMLNPTRVYPLEKYFAGSFIGRMKSFKIYGCRMEQMVIDHNYRWNLKQLI